MKIENAVTKIRKFFRINKRLPTYQELAGLFGFASKNAAYKLAQKLIKLGFIEKDKTGKLIPKNLFSPLTHAGIIAAGYPVPVESILTDVTSIDEFLIAKPEITFLLTVSGESMIDAGIRPGDITVIEKKADPKPGDIIIANIDGELTLKYFGIEQGRSVLIPANKNFSKIYPKNKLEIIGIVKSIIRKYN